MAGVLFDFLRPSSPNASLLLVFFSLQPFGHDVQYMQELVEHPFWKQTITYVTLPPVVTAHAASMFPRVTLATLTQHRMTLSLYFTSVSH
jgi:hypothetical protein